MLPAASRLRRRPEITAVVRYGRRGARPSLVVHLDVAPPLDNRLENPPDNPGSDDPDNQAVTVAPQVGFVVSRAVGNAVTRNRVRRRLRHLMAARLDSLPASARVVLRVLPPAATLSSAALAHELDAALDRATTSRRARA